MKYKIAISVPDFETVVDVSHMMDEPEYKRQRYAEDVAFERLQDRMGNREPWYENDQLSARVVK